MTVLSVDEFEKLAVADQAAAETKPISQRRVLSIAEVEKLGNVEHLVKNPTPGIKPTIEQNVHSALAGRDRTFYENVAESFKRGDQANHIFDMGYEASLGRMDIEKQIKPIRIEVDEIAKTDPIKGNNFLSDAVYSISGMIPALGTGIVKGAEGGMAMAIGTAAVGAPALAPAAFAAGQTTMSANYWYRQGAGELYLDLKDQDVDDAVAVPVSHVAGAIYGAIEFSQAKLLAPELKPAVRSLITASSKKFIAAMITRYGVNWVEEVGEEGLQAVVMSIAKDTALGLADKVDQTTGGMLGKAMTQGWSAIKESALPLFLMMAPGAALTTGHKINQRKAVKQAQAIMDKLSAEEKAAVDKVLFTGQEEDATDTEDEVVDEKQAKVNELKSKRHELMRAEVKLLNEDPEAPSEASFALPSTLSKSKPKYGYRGGLYDVSFASDFDKAAYIVAKDSKSKSHDKFVEALKSAGVSEADAKAHGNAVRAKIKTMAAVQFNDGEMSGELKLPAQPNTLVKSKANPNRAAQRTAELKTTRDRIRKIGFQIEKMEKEAPEGPSATEPKALKAQHQAQQAVAPQSSPISPEMAEKNQKIKDAGKKGVIKKKVGENVERAVDMAEDEMTPISSQLGRIHVRLKAAIVRFEHAIHRAISRDNDAVKPFQDKFKKMDEKDRNLLDLALKRRNVATINALLDKHGMQAEYAALNKVIAGVLARAQAVGFKVDELANYFPRVVKDLEGFFQHVQSTPEWTLLDEAMRKEQQRVGAMSDEQRAGYLNRILEGGDTGGIILEVPGAVKERTVQNLTPELNQFYHDSNTALTRYIRAMNTAIETRRFFGYAGEGEAKMDNVEGSIGALVLDLKQKNELSGEQAVKLGELLKARVNEVGPGQFIGLVKNLTYIDLLGGPGTALTQIADVALSLHRNGFFRTAGAVFDFVTGKAEVLPADVYIREINQEFSETRESGKWVAEVFRRNGLKLFDNFGKTVYINAAFQRLQDNAQDPRALGMLEPLFESEAASVLQDLKDGKVSENIKMLLAAELMDVQPLSLSEMPPNFAMGGDWRVRYMLRSYQIKFLDVARRDILDTFKTDKSKAMKNLITLSTAAVLSKMGVEALKDFLFNRDFIPDEEFQDAMLSLLGFNRYSLGQVNRQGPVDTMTENIIPAPRFIDSLYRDVKGTIIDGDSPIEWESIRSVPIGGELFYWWVGGGRSKMASKSYGGE